MYSERPGFNSMRCLCIYLFYNLRRYQHIYCYYNVDDSSVLVIFTFLRSPCLYIRHNVEGLDSILGKCIFLLRGLGDILIVLSCVYWKYIFNALQLSLSCLLTFIKLSTCFRLLYFLHSSRNFWLFLSDFLFLLHYYFLRNNV